MFRQLSETITICLFKFFFPPRKKFGKKWKYAECKESSLQDADLQSWNMGKLDPAWPLSHFSRSDQVMATFAAPA